MEQLVEAHRSRPRGGRLQHRLHVGAADACGRTLPCRSSGRCRRSSRPARFRPPGWSPCSGTEATVKREYTHALIREFAAGCDVTLVGSARLAALAESELRGEPVDDAAIAAEIAPCFVDNGTARTDTIVLACTHYPLLIERMRAPGALAGRFPRPGPGHRPARGRADRPARWPGAQRAEPHERFSPPAVPSRRRSQPRSRGSASPTSRPGDLTLPRLSA